MGEISTAVATDMGGRAEITTTKHDPSVVNDKEIAGLVVSSARDVLGEDMVNDKKDFMMGGEDFAFYLKHKPGAFFHIGMKDENTELAPWHNKKFIINEDALVVGPKVMFEVAKNFK